MYEKHLLSLNRSNFPFSNYFLFPLGFKIPFLNHAKPTRWFLQAS
jgi:hypothetical protein